MSEESNETTDETMTATVTAQRDEGSASDESQGGSSRSEAEASPDHQSEETVATESTDETDAARAARKVREGMVTSAGMDKTIVVTVTDRVRHAKYNKFVLRSKKLYTHDETNNAGVGDRVRVMETRPMSKNKRWRLVEILERAR
jgi:small subunit ribosomal protein S17